MKKNRRRIEHDRVLHLEPAAQRVAVLTPLALCNTLIICVINDVIIITVIVIIFFFFFLLCFCFSNIFLYLLDGRVSLPPRLGIHSQRAIKFLFQLHHNTLPNQIRTNGASELARMRTCLRQ